MTVFPDNIICTTSTITDGNMAFRFGSQDDVISARKHFLEKNTVTFENCVPMKSEHGKIIAVVDKKIAWCGATSRGETIPADVLVTQEKGLALLLTTADCQPVSFYDPVTSTIALAHISRHTLALQLATKTVSFLQTHFNINPADILIHIGPHIKKESYKFPLPLKTVSPILTPFIEEKDGYAYIDTLSASSQQLNEAGVLSKNISVSKIDTTISQNHFSHYRLQRDHTPEARMATIIALKNDAHKV